MTQTFKQVAHFHLGCKMKGGNTGEIWHLSYTILYTEFSSPSPFSESKPILIPMDKMSEADAKILCYMKRPWLEAYDLSISHWERGINGVTDSYECIVKFDRLSPEQFQFLLSRHYNVFNLPSEEFIDATTMEGGNPYL